jgi:hypothetical protein
LFKDEKNPTKKKKKNGTQWIFVGILILVMIEDVKILINKKKKKLAQDQILALAYSSDTV